MDHLRQDDLNQMKLMKKELTKMRKEEKISIKKPAVRKDSESNVRPTTGSTNSGIRTRPSLHQKIRAAKLRKM